MNVLPELRAMFIQESEHWLVKPRIDTEPDVDVDLAQSASVSPGSQKSDARLARLKSSWHVSDLKTGSRRDCASCVTYFFLRFCRFEAAWAFRFLSAARS